MGLILARKKANCDSRHTYKRLTLRALENDSVNLKAIEPFYSEGSLQNEYLTKAGTLIMKLSYPFNPAVITEDTEGYLIPSQMVSIKLVKHALPEYLCLYLSQDFVAKRLLANYFCIAQRAITVDSLLNLKVMVPSLKNQRIICDYYQNYRQICRLRENLEKEERAIMKNIFFVLHKDKEQK